MAGAGPESLAAVVMGRSPLLASIFGSFLFGVVAGASKTPADVARRGRRGQVQTATLVELASELRVLASELATRQFSYPRLQHLGHDLRPRPPAVVRPQTSTLPS